MFARKSELKCFFSFWLFVYFLGFPLNIEALFFDWLWPVRKISRGLMVDDGPLPSIPFEYESEDEKFLEEASKFTNLIKSSSLDICQHKVILQMKTSCNSMTEEELSKISVNLLNCQSQVDGRKIFPCTETMNLKECTKDMDANTWNAYHLMNNRARAVCLAARRTQFHALSEMTINKLMATASDQIKKMTSLLEGQEKLKILTQGTLSSMEKANAEFIKQQNTLTVGQKKIQDFVALNLKQLTTEKALIAAGTEELFKMVKVIKEGLDKANEELMAQSQERSQNHFRVLRDVEKLQKQANDILEQIGLNTGKLLAQHEIASQSYQVTFENLLRINDTVFYLLKIINATKVEIDERFYWIQHFLNGTDNQIERLLSITLHVIYLLFGMLFASFLNFPSAPRALLAIIVPLNLFVTYHQGPDLALNFFQISIFLTSSIIGITVIHKIYLLFISSNNSINHEKLKDHPSNKRIIIEPINNTQTLFEETPRRIVQNNSSALIRCYIFKIIHRFYELLSFYCGRSKGFKIKTMSPETNNILEDENVNLNKLNKNSLLTNKYSPSSHSRVNEWLQTKVDYTYSNSPSSIRSGSPKLYCSAICRSGRRCRNTTYLGRDVCHRHMNEDSIET